jgi:subtilisin family serine protease
VLHAPGRDILTLAPGGHYDFGSGSSLAAAHVSGLVALMLALPQAPPPAALGGLLEASRGTDGASPVNACRALVALGQPLSCGDAPAR